MVTQDELTGWLLIAFGLYAVAASIGEWVNPGRWKAMVEGLNESPALGFLAGLLVLAIGVAVALVHPMGSTPGWRGTLVSVIGYLMVLEGLAFLAAPKSISALCASLFRAYSPWWVVVSGVLGVVFLISGFPLI